MSIVAKWSAIVLPGLAAFWGAVQALAAEEQPVLDTKGNVIQRAALPNREALDRAEKMVEEVFGRDILKARSAADKTKLVQEILKSAREEQDMAVRFAALRAARGLAVEALDGKLGLEIIREIVSTYQPLEEMSKEDRLAEADRLWQQAERSQGREKLSKQLEAAEAYLYLLPEATGILQDKMARRLKSLDETYSFANSVENSEVKILGVFWGARNRFWDVSRHPKLKIEKLPIGIKVSIPNEFTDVWFGVHKILVVVYSENGMLKVATIWDGELPREIIIPGPLNKLEK